LFAKKYLRKGRKNDKSSRVAERLKTRRRIGTGKLQPFCAREQNFSTYNMKPIFILNYSRM